MKYLIREKPHHSFSHLINGIVPKRGVVLEDVYGAEAVAYTNSGRVALRIILDYLKAEKQILNKNTEVLVPQWMCMGVTMFLHKICFPTLTFSKNTKGIIVYHQYGFPQDMDKILPVARHNNWFIIENCVNVYESFYKGQKVGTFGLASIFSLAKMFPLPQGGALVSGNQDLVRYAKATIHEGHSSFITGLWNLSRLMNEYGDNNFWQKIQVMAESLSEYARKISSVSLNIAKREVNSGGMRKRQENYHFLLDYFKEYDLFQDLERDVIPYVVPLIAKEEVLQKIKTKLLTSGVWTDFYHFDVNRNILNPEFKRCVWVPIHQRIEQNEMEIICKLIKQVI